MRNICMWYVHDWYTHEMLYMYERNKRNMFMQDMDEKGYNMLYVYGKCVCDMNMEYIYIYAYKYTSCIVKQVRMLW